mmetsp:Transcript_29721/g.68410  ORF Transcript_29721/g.68410 Transcript_29721/m.68410 type:complete len:190 (+) Transcript_29721:123-692(+)
MGATTCKQSTCHEVNCWCKENDRHDNMHVVTAEGLHMHQSEEGRPQASKLKAFRDLEDEAIDVAKGRYDSVQEVPEEEVAMEEEKEEKALEQPEQEEDPDRYVVQISKMPQEKLGLMITNFPTKDRICVRGVAVGGAIQRWNILHPALSIMDGHYLLEINGIDVANKREEEIVRLLSESSEIKLVLSKR